MRTTKTLSVSLFPAQLRETEKLAKKENRTMSELVREALRRYQEQQRPREIRPSPSSLAAALAELRADAKSKGTNRLTMRQINAEITQARRQQDQKRAARPPAK